MRALSAELARKPSGSCSFSGESAGILVVHGIKNRCWLSWYRLTFFVSKISFFNNSVIYNFSNNFSNKTCIKRKDNSWLSNTIQYFHFFKTNQFAVSAQTAPNFYKTLTNAPHLKAYLNYLMWVFFCMHANIFLKTKNILTSQNICGAEQICKEFNNLNQAILKSLFFCVLIV